MSVCNFISDLSFSASAGTYELFVTCNGRPINGSPFAMMVEGDHRKSSFSSSSSSSSQHSIPLVRRSSSTKRTTVKTVKEPVSLWVRDPVQFGRESKLVVQLGDAEGEVSAMVTRDGIVVASELSERDKNTQTVR